MVAELAFASRMARVALAPIVAATLATAAAPAIPAGSPSASPPADPAVHFYSTAPPPASYPGPTPEEPAIADRDPFVGLSAADTDPAPPDPPVEEAPAPAPPGPAEVGSAPEASPESPAEPTPEPDRLASNTAADRVPVGTVPHPAPDASSVGEDPIARAKAMLASCKARYAEVRDYTCTFVKRERIGGHLSDFAVMAMKARTSPSSVYFKFRRPNAGREAIYVHGRDGGKAIVHDVGIGRLVAGTVHLDPRSRRAMEGNRHPITEAGIGFMIDTLTEGWHREMDPQESVVTIREGVLVNRRPTTMIVCTHSRREKHFVFHEVRLYIDREHGLPIRFEAYDWPRSPGEAPPLAEEYTYTDLRLNVGLTDHDFDPSNKAYSFGRF